MDAIDKLLIELQTEYQDQKSPTQQQQKPKVNPPKPLINTVSKSDSLIDNLLAEVQADFVERDAAEEFKKQQELEQEKIRQAQLKTQQLETLTKEAKAWLSQLDPFSSEGLWFERFAESYSSKLDAAIDYLHSN